MIEELNNIALSLKVQLDQLLPQILMTLLVLLVGYILARLVKYLVIRTVRYISRLINQRFEQINFNQSAGFIGTAFFWLVMLATFTMITNMLKLTIVTTGLESILRYSPNVIAAILIIFLAVVVGKFITKSIILLSIRLGISYGNTLGKIAQYLILLTAIIIAIDQIGIEVTFIVNILNITLASLLFGAAFAFGLGARTSVSNILATFYVRKMYKEGDQIRIGEIEGRIIKIEATVVVLDTDSGQYIIPAKEFNETKSLLIKKQ